MPRPVESRLENGLTILVLEDHRFPIVTVQFDISGAGSLYDPAGLPGLAAATAQMLGAGSATRSSREIAEQIEALGASLSAVSSFGSSAAIMNATGLSETFEDWLAITADALLNPGFPADELNGLRQRFRSQVAQQRSASAFLASERFNSLLYGAHPASVIATSPAAIDSMNTDVLKKWHRERYSPENTIIGIAGDVSAPEVLALLKKHFSAWHSAGNKENIPPEPQHPAQRTVAIVDRPGSPQTSLVVGNLGIDRRSPDLFSVFVGNQILGGTAAGRLFLNLRERHGYTYGAFSTVTALKYPGVWKASADVRSEVSGPALRAILDEIQRLQSEKVSEPELAAAKRSIAASFALSLEDPNQILNYLTLSSIYGYSKDYWDNYSTRIMEVTADEVQLSSRKYLDPDHLQIAASGDAKKLQAVLK